MPNQFHIVFTGKILPGFAPEQVRQAVTERLRLSGANLEALFSGRRAVLKRGLDFDTGNTIREEYAKLGMKVHLEPERPIAAAARAALNDTPDILPPLADHEVAAPPPVKTPPAKPAPAVAAPAVPKEPVALSLTDTPAVSDEISCPKCGARQPKRTLCRACGLDMPRFIDGQQQAERDARQARKDAAVQKRPAAISRPPRTKEREAVEGDDPPLIGIGFSGRFSRSRYLVSGFISVGVMCISLMLSPKMGYPVFGIAMLFMLIQGLRSMVLRLHDMGHSGLLVLLTLIPFFGSLFALAMIFWPGTAGENDYGDEPSAAPLPLQLAGFLVMVVLAAMTATRMDQVVRAVGNNYQESSSNETPDR